MNDTNNMARITECSLGQVLKNGRDKYFVPLYQREYAWGKVEIRRLLNDLFSAFWNGAGRNYYLGSLVVRKNGEEFELVDGQQRLITLSILFALYLNDNNADKVLRFQLRKEADACIDACYNGAAQLEQMEQGDDAFGLAVKEMREFFPEILDESSERGKMPEVLGMEREGVVFRDYLIKKVVLFRIEIPEETDVNSYFEIMNSRGEQLQYHEIMKAELMAKLHEKCKGDPGLSGRYDELAGMFDDIWSACSKMNGYLGHHLHMSAEYLSKPKDAWTDAREWGKYQKPIDKEVGKDEDEQSVIWDFSNFLMHVLKCYQLQYIHDSVSDVVVTLDERDMQVKYEKLEKNIDPIRFLDLLIRLRLKFDNFVVKAENDENGDVEAWHLLNVKKSKKSYNAVNTFGENDVQARLIYFEAMLQVSFNTQRNKDWLQHILELDDAELENGENLLANLKEWARTRLTRFKDDKEKAGKDFYCLGLESSRFMLNLVDYLMWENYVYGAAGADFDVPREFVFKYLNSVEHHHPQHDDQVQKAWTPEEIDDIGNLFLVYSVENSSMSNRQPQEKKLRYMRAHNDALPDSPKRYWMYAHTDENGAGWTKSDMRKLSQYVRELFAGFLSPVMDSPSQ